ncbi:hypothetical protein MMC27_000837 [Xylographa pallens]|nr:hypothetical protein [Xylographa pallens]
MGYCVGQIKGDPDIAGIGVVISFFVATGITLLLSTILWYYTIVLKHDLEPRPRAKIPIWVQVLQKVLVMLGDTHLVTGLAVMIASSINIMMDVETPLYHIFVARSLADTAFVGHAAAIIHVYPTKHNWLFRLGLVTAAMSMWLWWTSVAIVRFREFERNDYENNATPVCLENNNIFALDYTTWMYISLVPLPFSYSMVYLGLWSNGRKLVDGFEEWITAWPLNIAGHVKTLRDAGERLKSMEDVVKILIRVVLLAISSVLLLIFWAFALLIPASRTLSPIQGLISLVWDIYDVYVVRKANADIIVVNPDYRIGKSFQNNDNPENDWGFGQILPFAMLLLPLLTALDFVSGEPKIWYVWTMLTSSEDVREDDHHQH